MVDLSMVHDDRIDFGQIDLRFQIIHEDFGIGSPHRVDEYGLLLFHEIGVVGRPLVGGVIAAMESSQFVVDESNPIHIVLDIDMHGYLPK